jgi:hypothetical protein
MDSVLSKYVERRLHPTRVTVNLLHHELELAKGNKDITLDRELLESVVTTLELFIEDFDSKFRTSAADERPVEKRFVDAAKATIKI